MDVATTRGRVIPITILTGFLGAGKTTLLNRILRGDHGLKVAVLVNDFGSVSIDAELVVDVEDDVVSVANGCICCTVRDDLVATVTAAIDRPERPEYILLEASGVSEPTSIAQTFNTGSLRDRIRTDSVLCVVDAEQVFAAPETMELKLFQMACADMIILNKVDLVERDDVAKIASWLDARFHRYQLVEATHCDVPLEVLLAVGRLDPTTAGWRPASERLERTCAVSPCDHDHDHDHAQSFATWSYETDEALSLEALRDVASNLPSAIYRAKGVVRSSDAPSRRAIVQVVGRRVDISLADPWEGTPPRTQIVAVGAAGTIDEDGLRAAIDRCVDRSGI